MTVQPFMPAEMALAGGELPLGVRNIIAWAGALNAATSLVEALVDTPFMPVSFWPLPQGVAIRDFPNPALKHPRESPEERGWRRQTAIAGAAAAVMLGGQLRDGLGQPMDPLVALSAIYVVRGRPGMYAEAMSALVKSHGHELVTEDLTDHRCVIRARRQGQADWQRYVFTMERARKAGYAKQNPKYDADPQTMLFARCTSIAARAIAPDVLKGMASIEELGDDPDGSPAIAATRTVRRAVPAPAARPALPGMSQPAAPTMAPQQQSAPAGPPLPGEEPSPEPLQSRTWDAINRSFFELEVVGDGQKAMRLAVISHIVGREITQGRDLTAIEGQLVLDNLAGDNGHHVVSVALQRNVTNSPEVAAVNDAVQAELDGAGPDDDQDVEELRDWPNDDDEADS